MIDKTSLQTFFTKIAVVDRFKGKTTLDFDPLELFAASKKHIGSLYWNIPEDDHLRDVFVRFLEYNQG